MELHKLCANHEKLSPDPEQNYNFATLTETKTLGVSWKPNLDCFLIKVKVCLDSSYTKRDVLSTIAKIFDPVGLMAPVISKAKIFLQRLWRSKLEWNDLLPAEEYREWQQFLVSLENINNIEIPRRIFVAFPEVIEIHGFADFLHYFELVPDLRNTIYHKLLKEFHSITKLPNPNQPGKHNAVHYIMVAKPRKLAPDRFKIAKTEFQNMMHLGHLRPSKSKNASPLYMVPKKGTLDWRPVGDYRALNSQTLKDKYPIPCIADFTTELHGSKIFSRIDLLKAIIKFLNVQITLYRNKK
ncbi:retrovirus-related Pol polyprotein from transposon opus [Trichonephila clavipes]|uniref:Retrovirus-related Pol polyprotein from transposon opus n=1 Tax=Trichonephila clavipes TaxID=2585209 RepID=A0A8X6VIX2_TRICX|nr:retrovirus-related Pol polyprotein from transposon opus [Trichonephila clavipes]